MKVSDFETGTVTDTVTGEKEPLSFPKSNILSYALSDGSTAIVRPSGTEPKIKVYIAGCGKTKADAEKNAGEIGAAMKKLLKIEG